jgi:hypothetical protein
LITAKDPDMMEAAELKAIFDVIGEQVPKLLENVSKVLYNAAEGAKLGESVAAFYKSLRAAGMTDQQAFELTKSYMDTVSLGGLLRTVMQGWAKGKGDVPGEKKCNE